MWAKTRLADLCDKADDSVPLKVQPGLQGVHRCGAFLSHSFDLGFISLSNSTLLQGSLKVPKMEFFIKLIFEV